MTVIEDILKTLETQYDDIIWDCGTHDPRLEDLTRQIVHYKELIDAGEIYEPDF